MPEKAVYGFLGRNGAGKTTTLKMLLGLLLPTSGTALVCGVDVARDRIGTSRQVGALLEAHGFYANLTGRENLDITRTLLGLSAKEADRVLEVVDMNAHARRRVSDYSLGMRQRLGLARAMLGAPRVLILDEPTNGLDPDGIADMRHFLRDLPDRTGATILLSSHFLGEIEQIATDVGIIHDGQLVLEGRLSTLMAGLAPGIMVRTADPLRATGIIRSRGLNVEPVGGALVVRLSLDTDADAASGARRYKVTDTHQPTRPGSGQPIEAPQLALLLAVTAPCLIGVFAFFSISRFDTAGPWEQWLVTSVGVWAFFMLPMSVTALTALVGQLEHAPRAWDHLRALPVPRARLYAAKAICVVGLIVVMSALNLGITFGVVQLASALKPAIAPTGNPDLLMTGWLLTKVLVAALLMIAIQFWTALRFSSFVPALALGIGGTFFAVVATGAKQGVFFPWQMAVNVMGDGWRHDTALALGGGLGLLAMIAAIAHLAWREVP